MAMQIQFIQFNCIEITKRGKTKVKDTHTHIDTHKLFLAKFAGTKLPSKGPVDVDGCSSCPSQHQSFSFHFIFKFIFRAKGRL